MVKFAVFFNKVWVHTWFKNLVLFFFYLLQTLKQNTEPVSEETVPTDEPRKKESVATQTPGRTVKNSKSQQDSTTPTQIPVSLLLSLG